MTRVRLALVAFIAGISLSAPSLAATVTVLQGQVLINRGQGYQLIDGTTEASPGDTVVVNPGGSAQIAYPDGCSMQFQPGSVVAIAAQSPCSAQQQQSGASGLNGTTLAIGAVAIGAGVGAALLLGQDDKPASP